MNKEATLKNYIHQISRLEAQEESLSVDGLEALSRIYVALYNLVVVKSLDTTLGSRLTHHERLKRLYGVSLKRYRKEKNFIQRCRLVNILQYLSNEPFGFNLPWRNQSFDLTGKFIEEEMPLHHERMQPEWLWCVAYWFYPMNNDCTEDRNFRCFKKQLASWVIQLDGKDRWGGLSMLEVLQRLDILNANSYLFLDETYGPIIRSLYAYCRKQTKIAATTDKEALQTMGLLYEQALNFNAYPAETLTQKVVIQAMKDSHYLLAEYSDEWLYVFSYLMFDLCEAIMGEF